MSKLQLYFDYYVEHFQPETDEWYGRLNKALTEMEAIQIAVRSVEISDAESAETIIEEKLNEAFESVPRAITEIKNISDFLNRFIFEQSNGVGNVKQGVVWDTNDNPHKQQIINNAIPSLLLKIIQSSDKLQTDVDVRVLLNSDRNVEAVHFRLMRTLFPNDFAAPDATNKLERLIKALRNKLGVIVNGQTYLEKHQNLCALIETDNVRFRQMFTWQVYYLLENELTLKKAICYYGAPGTGKTYRSSREAKKAIDGHRIVAGKAIGEQYAIKTVQFHPSYSYEDFIEGIRPSQGRDLKLFNGSFKQFCKDNSLSEISLYKDTEFLKNQSFQEVDYDFSQIKISKLNSNQKEILGIEGNTAEGLTIQDVIEPAFFIIDEINRAELSKVFGELMYSLEYRGYSGKIKSQYSHLCTSENDLSAFFWEREENWFFIPQNVYLIATMNNIDRSVDAFDFALRRRFMWHEVHPNYDVIRDVLSKKGWELGVIEKLTKGLKQLNDQIENDNILDRNYRIGHSYVLELAKLTPDRFDGNSKASEFIWGSFIAPLLEEYLKDLGNEQKAKEKIVSFKKAFIQ